MLQQFSHGLHSVCTFSLWLFFTPVAAWCVQEDRTMYQALECCAQDAIGSGGSWAALMDSGLVNNLGG